MTIGITSNTLMIQKNYTWHNLASQQDHKKIKTQLANYLPSNPIDLPEVSLIPLQEHHVPPFRSKEYFFSQERKDWMKRFGD